MERLPEKLRPPRDIRLRWALTAERQEKRYRRQQEKTAKMAAAFAENGIRMLVLKGLGLSRDYPVPAHRECGDIDIYLFGASDEGDRLLLQMGAQPYFDVPKHSSHTWDGILIENHRTILNVRRNRNERELNALLTAVLEQEGVCEIGENIAVPPATFNAIYLLRHAAVHYQKEGIAVRHLCDWACFLERHGHEIDRQLFHKALADYRLDRFEALMTAAAVRYLGAEVPEPDCDAGMLERFMREIYAMRPMPTRTLPKLYFKLFSPIHNRWRAAPRPADVPVALLLRHDTRPVERKVHPVPIMRRRPRREVRTQRRTARRIGTARAADRRPSPGRRPRIRRTGRRGRRRSLLSPKNQKKSSVYFQLKIKD